MMLIGPAPFQFSDSPVTYLLTISAEREVRNLMNRRPSMDDRSSQTAQVLIFMRKDI
jgi:hypothetical protein